MNTPVAIFKDMRKPLCALWNKWQGEKRGAPFQQYRKEAQAHLEQVAPDATFVNARPKPFALIFKLGEYHYKLTVTATRYSIKRML